MTTQQADGRINFDDLRSLLRNIFLNHGTSSIVADILAANCAGCERDGAISHGIFRIPGYVASLATGWVDGKAEPDVDRTSPSFIRIDARNGFAQPALAAGAEAVRTAVESAGIAIIAIRNSHHFSALWPDVEPFARDGLLALTFVNGLANVVPHGGHTAVYGTNPIAFATPVADAEPLVVDQATSVMANGEVRLHALANSPLPPGTGLDSAGRPSTDPHAILAGGALNTFGGYKGSSIALMVELMAGALTGGQLSFENDFGECVGAQTPKAGQLLMVIDPTRGGNAGFAQRVSLLCSRLIDAGQDRLPGQRRYASRLNAQRLGIPISQDNLFQLRTLAG
ncbi:Ldh family oxidoreductase [Mesorhizobium neociceri]|uniref:Ldh family oxidoreductase n=1 Tax=Mesorhizobium neociceri TaxID=1307853 RepID=A0A838AXI1_9HYPH|nr:Ldh family oxidoreductase [Mesorhizobium neociceri]MBA1138765.1 Ldh family oxidoreductase [Mesorhizobium neociceri]